MARNGPAVFRSPRRVWNGDIMNLGYVVSSAICSPSLLLKLPVRSPRGHFIRFIIGRSLWPPPRSARQCGFRGPLSRDRLCRRIADPLRILMLVLAVWRSVVGSASVDNITSPTVEIFY